MSQSIGNISCASWDLTAAAPSQCRDASNIQDSQHPCDLLNKTYQKALSALESAANVVSGIASGLHDLEASQTDVSARLVGRATRFTGRKRKLSPSVYDYNDGCFAAASKADTPTQELLPASRSELRNHQLQAVRWLASLERQGAGGVLADELELDRTAEVAGLMSHLTYNPPEPTQIPPTQIGLAPTAAASCGGSGFGGGAAANVCLLLAPGSRVGTWAEAIREHVDVQVHVYDGTADSAAALHAATCAATSSSSSLGVSSAVAGDGGGGGGGGSSSTLGGGGGLTVLSAQQPQFHPGGAGGGCGVQFGPMGHQQLNNPNPNPIRRMATGGAGPLSSAAGVFPPSGGGAAAAAGMGAAIRQGMGGLAAAGLGAGPSAAGCCLSSSPTQRLLVVISSLEHLARDAPLLTQMPQRVLVVDLAPPPTANATHGGGGGAAAAAVAAAAAAAADGGDVGDPMADGLDADACGGGSGGPDRDHSGDLGFGCFGGFRSLPGSQPGSGGSGPAGGGHGGGHGGRRRMGMALEDYPHLHLLTRMPAASRVLLSAGVPDPAGDGIWLLLQLLAPNVQRQLWRAMQDLQQAVLAAGGAGAQVKEGLLAEVQGRLWALLRPLMLHRRARDVDLATMRTAATSLNLYDHFSAARAEGE